eukprot:337304_1
MAQVASSNNNVNQTLTQSQAQNTNNQMQTRLLQQRDNALQEQAKLNQDLNAENQKLQEQLTTQMTNYRQKALDYDAQIVTLKTETEEAKQKGVALQNKLERLELQLDSLKTETEEAKRKGLRQQNALRQQITRLEVELDSSNDQRSEYEESLKEYEEHKKEITRLKREQTQHNKRQNKEHKKEITRLKREQTQHNKRQKAEHNKTLKQLRKVQKVQKDRKQIQSIKKPTKPKLPRSTPRNRNSHHNYKLRDLKKNPIYNEHDSDTDEQVLMDSDTDDEDIEVMDLPDSEYHFTNFRDILPDTIIELLTNPRTMFKSTEKVGKSTEYIKNQFVGMLQKNEAIVVNGVRRYLIMQQDGAIVVTEGILEEYPEHLINYENLYTDPTAIVPIDKDDNGVHKTLKVDQITKHNAPLWDKVDQITIAKLTSRHTEVLRSYAQFVSGSSSISCSMSDFKQNVKNKNNQKWKSYKTVRDLLVKIKKEERAKSEETLNVIQETNEASEAIAKKSIDDKEAKETLNEENRKPSEEEEEESIDFRHLHLKPSDDKEAKETTVGNDTSNVNALANVTNTVVTNILKRTIASVYDDAGSDDALELNSEPQKKKCKI